MKLELTVPTQNVFDAIINGAEGGIQYWAKAISLWTPAQSARPDESETDLPLVCDLIERDSGEHFSLHGQWAIGLRLMAERYPRNFAELVSGTGDCTTGDVLIQLAAFGELRYG